MMKQRIFLVTCLALLNAIAVNGQYSLPHYSGLVPDQCGSWNNGANYITTDENFVPDPSWDGEGCLWFPLYNYVVGNIQATIVAPGARLKYVSANSPYPCAGIPTCMPDADWAVGELSVNEANEWGKVHYVVVHFEDFEPGISSISFSMASIASQNIRIGIAYEFCEDYAQEVILANGEYGNINGCVYYRFYVEEDGPVRIDFSGDIEMVNVYGPLPTVHPGPWLGLENGCTIGDGALMLPGPDFELNETMEHGFYYVQARTTMVPGMVYINVEEGVACIDPPPNEDCDEAVPFCDDLTVEVDPEWASNGTKCLWYTFSVSQPGPVHLDVNSPGSLIRLYGPMPPGASCEDYLRELCGSPGFIAQGTSGMGYHSDLQAGIYYVNVEIDTDTPGPIQFDVQEGIECVPCENCIPGFQLTAGQRYVVSAWTNVPGSASSVYTYTTPLVSVEAPWSNSLGTFFPSGSIIDGWQRIEGEFTMPSTGSFRLQLKVLSGTALFDDVRVFPADGSVKCYVYDPQTLRFVAELDERHYATFYEYDGEGKLTRIKKETERGIMTIQETRYSNSDRNH